MGLDYKKDLTNELPKHPKGITDIPVDFDFNEFKTYLLTNPLVRNVTKTKLGHAAVTFLSNSAPTSVNSYAVKPSLLSILRCKMFGHITNKCQNETKCPHCA